MATHTQQLQVRVVVATARFKRNTMVDVIDAIVPNSATQRATETVTHSDTHAGRHPSAPANARCRSHFHI